MVERLDNKVAESLVPDYNPALLYELETDVDGLYVLGLDPETGEKSAFKLAEEAAEYVPKELLWDEESLETKGAKLRRETNRGWVIAIAFVTAVVVLVCKILN